MIDYKSSGVDINKGNRFVEQIKKLTGNMSSRGVISSIGGFSSLFSLSYLGCDLVLSSSTDGVGTKLLVAQMAGIHNTIGIDLVAMNVNDIITTGTMPLFFLDYISYSDVEDKVLVDIVRGIIDGLSETNASLIGGETAQMPGVYDKGRYDIAGFCVGIGKREGLLPKELNYGMVLIGFESSGFHSNGYSLLRKLFFEVGGYKLDSLVLGRPLVEVLLRPTKIYVKLFEKVQLYVKACAHITGGGFYDNIPRMLNGKFNAVIERKKMPEVDIFKFVSDLGKITEKEMFRTFNMGIGFVCITDEVYAEIVLRRVGETGIRGYKIGYLEKGSGEVIIV